MMDEFIYWRKPYLLLSSTCEKLKSWIIEIWMKIHLISDNNCNTINLQSPKKFQGMTHFVGLTFSVGDTKP